MCRYSSGRCRLRRGVFVLSLIYSLLFTHIADGLGIDTLAGWYLPDGVTGPETNPLGDGTVLLLSFGKLLLGAETLVALY
jgi:hypothetical protein